MDNIFENLGKIMGYVPKKKELFDKLAEKYGNDDAHGILKDLFTLDIRDPRYLRAWEELLAAVAPGKTRQQD
jgi:hypothetical protein